MSGADPVSVADFPPGFLWGVATASYQVEGAASEGGRGPSIWDTFSHTPGRTHNGDTGDVSVDHYHRFKEDVALMAEIGVNAYRFSISWSRVLPDGTGAVNEEGLAFYRELCAELMTAGITPAATLYHWDLPQALQDRGGWEDPASIEWFVEYAATVKEGLGDLVRLWTTFNEPWCTAFLGHSAGEHAPGVQNPATAFVVAHHLMVAHHEAVGVMRTVAPHPEDKVGIVLNMIPAWPQDGSDESVVAARGIDAIQNGLFFEAALEGRYPDVVADIHRELNLESRIDPARLLSVVEPPDFVGVNYYNINRIAHVDGAPPLGAWPGVPNATVARPPGTLTEMGWGVEPDGLVWALNRVRRRWPHLPILIMENGSAYRDEVGPDGEVRDPMRADYLRTHIAALQEAIQGGVELEGYFVWSLLDNFEWSRGYSKRFGIVHVDYDTLERTIKESGYWYRDFLAGRSTT